MKCEKCGLEGDVVDVTGRDRRVAYLKERYKRTPDKRRPALAETIMDNIDAKPAFRCLACVVCGCCKMVSERLAPCDICGGLACSDCSLPALATDPDGRIVDKSDEGKILCLNCNPPNSGPRERVISPVPTPSTELQPV